MSEDEYAGAGQLDEDGGPADPPIAATPRPDTPAEPGPPEEPETRSAQQGQRFVFVLSCVGAWTALDAVFKSAIPGPVGAPLAAAASLIVLFAAAGKVPALRARFTRLGPLPPWRSRRWLIVPGVAMLLLAGGGIGVAYLIQAPVATGAAAQGTITWPRNGATDVAVGKLNARGIARNIEPKHRLLLFLQWAGVHKYWAGDPDVVVTNGQWTGTIDIGAPGHIILWLVDQGPKTIQAMNHDGYYWSNGFPTLKPGPDETVLGRIAVIAQ